MASCQVFVSHHVVFEEGKPHHTSASVGEQIPLFSSMISPADNVPAINNQLTLDQTIPNQHIPDH